MDFRLKMGLKWPLIINSLLFASIFFNSFYLKMCIKYQIDITQADNATIILTTTKHLITTATFTLFIIYIKNKFNTYITTIIYTSLIGIIQLAILIYFNYFGFIPFIDQIKNIGNLLNIKNQITHQIVDTKTFILITSIILSVIISIFSKNTKIKLNNKIETLIIITTIAFFIFNTTRINKTDYTYARNSCFVKNGLAYTVYRDFLETIRNSSAPALYPGRINQDEEISFNTKNRNVIVIQIESLESNVLDILGNIYLTKLKKNSEYFPNFYSQHSGGGTTDAELSTLFSLLPLQNKVGLNTQNLTQFKTLPDALTSKSYYLSMFHSYSSEFFNRNYSYKKLGFNQIHDINSFTGKAAGWNALDSAFLEQSFKIIQKQPQPFFSYLITIQSHGPFENHSQNTFNALKKHFSQKYSDTQIHYLASIFEVSLAIENFIKIFQKSNLYENTDLIIFGDHESEIFKLPNQKDHVPLYIFSKNTKAKLNIVPCSHLDLAPLIISRLNIKIDSSYKWLGSYPSLINRQIIFNDGTTIKFQSGDLKNIIDTSTFKYINFSKKQLE